MDDIQNLFKETIAEFMEGSIESELDEELGYEPYDIKNKTTDNSRNGHSKKTLRTSMGKVEIDVPRDRNGDFEPKLLPKNQTSISQDMENKIISMYAKGDKKQIINFFNAVLVNDDFTLDILYRKERYDSASVISEYDEKTKTLSYRYRIPNSDEICVIDRFVYDEESGEVIAKELDKTHAKRVRMHLLQTLLLCSAARIICSDESKNIEFINLTGFIRYYDRAYENNRDINVVKLNISREIILQINPERANISELFKRVLKGKFKTSAGLYDKEPVGLTEIK